MWSYLCHFRVCKHPIVLSSVRPSVAPSQGPAVIQLYVMNYCLTQSHVKLKTLNSVGVIITAGGSLKHTRIFIYESLCSYLNHCVIPLLQSVLILLHCVAVYASTHIYYSKNSYSMSLFDCKHQMDWQMLKHTDIKTHRPNQTEEKVRD